MEIKYSIIPALGQSPVHTSKERTLGITQEYFKLGLPVIPEGNGTLYAVGQIQNAANPDEWALAMDLDYQLLVTEGFNTGYLFTLYGTLVDGTERAEIQAKINAAKGGYIRVGDILPSSVTLYDYSEMVTMGWIKEDPLT